MPIYEYLCSECNAVSEFIKLGKEELDRCKECGSKNIDRIISECSFRLVSHPATDVAPWFSERYLRKKAKRKKRRGKGKYPPSTPYIETS